MPSGKARSRSFALNATAAALAGLALRLFLVLRFPFVAGDSTIYEELAQNWLHEHVYGIYYAAGLTASDIRVPGYPAFVALAYWILRRGELGIVLAQTLLDLGTCFLVAWLAFRLAPQAYRRGIGIAALWLAATCPFVANYAAAPLTEVLATFLTAAALVPMVGAVIAMESPNAAADDFPWRSWLLAGFLVGLATLVRPESPLLLVALALVFITLWRHRTNWEKLVRVGALTAAGLILPLLPWAARNWLTLHEVQFLAPLYAASPDEYTPRGFYAWTATWLVRYRDVYLVPWKIGTEPVKMSDIPPTAFDSPEERARVSALLDEYNATSRMTADVDDGFAALARDRTARHPLWTYVWVPFERIFAIWFTPRTELLPISGHLTPIHEQWQDDPLGLSVTIFLGALNFFYVGLGVVGLWRAHVHRAESPPGVRSAFILPVVFIVVRTLYLTQVQTPEPRYVLECFPALFALGAQAWLPRRREITVASPAARGEL